MLRSLAVQYSICDLGLLLCSQLTEDLEKEEKKNAALQDCTDSLLQRIADVYPDILEQVIKTLEEEC